MRVALSQEAEATMIRLDGAIDITTAGDLKAALLEAIEAGSAISVVVDTATDLDVTAVQLLWAANREAKRAGIKFAVAGTWCEPVRSLLESMGLGGALG